MNFRIQLLLLFSALIFSFSRISAGSVSPQDAWADTIVYRDTQDVIATDSFVHHLGKIPARNMTLIKPFKYVGTEPGVITRVWTGDPHFICSYPSDVMHAGSTHTMKVCFYLDHAAGSFHKQMGFVLNNDRRITFTFKGILPDR